MTGIVPWSGRIDITVDVPAVEAADLALPPPAEGTAQVSARVTVARTRQRARYDGLLNGDRPVRCNADLDGEVLDRFATPDAALRSGSAPWPAPAPACDANDRQTPVATG